MKMEMEMEFVLLVQWVVLSRTEWCILFHDSALSEIVSPSQFLVELFFIFLFSLSIFSTQHSLRHTVREQYSVRDQESTHGATASHRTWW